MIKVCLCLKESRNGLFTFGIMCYFERIIYLEHMNNVIWKHEHGKIGCKVMVSNNFFFFALININIHIKIISFI